MKNLFLFLMAFLSTLHSVAQSSRTPFLMADFGGIIIGSVNNQPITRFSTSNVGLYYTGLFKNSLEIGVNGIVVNDKANVIYENHYGLRLNYLFAKKTPLKLYVGLGAYYTLNNDRPGEKINDAVSGKSTKVFLGTRYHFKKWAFIKAELGNYRQNLENRTFALHPTFGLGIMLSK